MATEQELSGSDGLRASSVFAKAILQTPNQKKQKGLLWSIEVDYTDPDKIPTWIRVSLDHVRSKSSSSYAKR